VTDLGKTSIIAATAANLLFLLTDVIPYQQQLHYFNTAEAGEAECIDYDLPENTITINCDAFFLDVVQAIDDDDPEILENLGNGDTF
jgi:hypothetical protein